ncbi:MAG TPA: TIGR03619 family F420-dependent LLM class oxidoreductase [Ilumatobacteraceae bacterium]
MQFSLTLFGLPIAEYAPIAVLAEELGFEAVWFGDHLVTPTSFAPTYPYDDSGSPNYGADTPIVDVMVMIGHIAALTTRIRLGPGVYILPLRDPFVAARAAATAQDLCQGRLMFGVGVGWMREEFDVVAQSFADRGSRTDEALAVLHELWSGRPVAHTGSHYAFEEVCFSPAPAVPIPIVLGGTTDAALRRTARWASGWFAPHRPLHEAQAVRQRLDVMLAEAGRSVEGFELWYRLVDPPSPDVLDAYAAQGVEHLVLGPFWAGGADRSSPLALKLAAIERIWSLLHR